MRPLAYAASSTSGPMKVSASVSARRLDVIVVYAAPGIARWARKILMTSPPRAGTIAFVPTPARYAARMLRQRTRPSG